MIEQTLVIVKPHAVECGLVGRIISIFEQKGCSIFQIKALRGSSAFWKEFYPSTEEWLKNVGEKTIESNKEEGIDTVERFGTDKPIEIGWMVKGWLAEDMASGPVVAIILEGNDIAKKARLVCGATAPNQALPGTIRFDFSSDTPSMANSEKRPMHNVVHCADPKEMRNGKSAFDYEAGMIFLETF